MSNETFKLIVDSDAVRQYHPTYDAQSEYAVSNVITTDGVEYLRFTIRVPYDNGLGQGQTAGRFCYIPRADAPALVSALRDIYCATSDDEEPDPQETVPEYDEAYAHAKGRDPEHGGRWCSECCTCHDDEDEGPVEPWDYEAHTAFENSMHDMFVAGLVHILEAPSILLFDTPATDLPNRRARARRS